MPRQDKVKYGLLFHRDYTAMKFSKQQSKYESEFTLFLKDLKQKDPELERKQREGRAIWWDKTPIDLDERKRSQESRVNQQAYVYQSK